MSRSLCATTAGATALAVAAALAVAPLGASAAPESAPAVSAYSGLAYGTSGHFGNQLTSGRSSLAPMCTTKAGVTHSAKSLGVKLPGVATVGAVHGATSSHKSGATRSSVSTAKTAASSLLGGMVKLGAINVSAKAAHKSSGYGLTASTTVVGGTVLGKALPVHPTANQTFALPNIGTIVLNKQTRSKTFGAHRISVIGLELKVGADNSLNLPAGSLVISRARAQLHNPTRFAESGSAWGSSGQSGSTVISDKSGVVYLPCGGTGGETRSNNTGKAGSGVVDAGATRTTAKSIESGASSEVITRSKVAGASLLDGALTVGQITARANLTRTGDKLTRSSAGTSVAGLTVNGKKFKFSQAPNTKYSVPGLGTLWINRVIKTSAGMKVYALELTLSKAQDGVSAGSHLILGGAKASLTG